MFVAPVLPMLTDTVDHLDRLLAELRHRGSPPRQEPRRHCTFAREHGEGYFSWLRGNRPGFLVAGYERRHAAVLTRPTTT